MIGKQIINYRIEKLLNKSSMSAVYKAIDTQHLKPVAVKAYNPYLVKGTKLTRHIKNELPTLSRLQHSHIVQAHEFIEQPDGALLVMDYVEGTKLDEYIKNAGAQLPAEQIITLFLQILKAVAFAHKREVLHKDIKPSNILITPEGEAKVLFYSTSRFLAADAPVLAKTGFKLGTVLYKSPEEIYGKQTDVRSDIYALGVVLYEMISGRSPYSLESQSEFEIQNKIVYEPLYKANEIESGLRGKLQALVNKATAKNPDDRFADCDDFITNVLEVQHAESEQQFEELIQEVSLNSGSGFSYEDTSIIKIAERQKRIKTLQGVFAVLSLMVACIFVIAITYRYISTKKQYAQQTETDTTTQESLSGSAEPESPVQTEEVEEEDTDKDTPGQPSRQVASIAATASAGVASETDLQFRIQEYYDALQSKDVEQIQSFYKTPLTRFFNEYGVSETLLQQLINQSYERTPEAKYTILWETFRYSRDERGNYVMDFYMHYNYKRANRKSWRTQKIYTMIKMNKDLKINYITGD